MVHIFFDFVNCSEYSILDVPEFQIRVFFLNFDAWGVRIQIRFPIFGQYFLMLFESFNLLVSNIFVEYPNPGHRNHAKHDPEEVNIPPVENGSSTPVAQKPVVKLNHVKENRLVHVELEELGNSEVAPPTLEEHQPPQIFEARQPVVGNLHSLKPFLAV
jgi:hypothetical protein